MCDCCEAHGKKCAGCGADIKGTGVVKGGKVYCSSECSDKAAA